MQMIKTLKKVKNKIVYESSYFYSYIFKTKKVITKKLIEKTITKYIIFLHMTLFYLIKDIKWKKTY